MPVATRLSSSLLLVLCLTLFFAPPHARGSDLDRLLDLLVKKGLVTTEEARALREGITSAKVSETSPAAAAQPEPKLSREGHPGNNFPSIKLSGWVQARWTNTTGNNNSFELRRARIALDGNLAEKITYRVQVDAVRSPVLLDARVDLNYFSFARLTVGQFKIPFSYENLISSRDLIPIERSQVVNQLVPGRDNGSNGRDIGVQLAGTLARRNERPVLDYSVGMFNGAGTNRVDDNRHKDAAARLVVYPFAGLSVAGDYYNGATGVQELLRSRSGVELAYVAKGFSLRGEYIWGRDAATRKDGWYSQIAYRLRPPWEVLFRFEQYDPNRRLRNDETTTYLMGINWYFRKQMKFQVNYGLLDRQARPLGQTALTQLQFQF